MANWVNIMDLVYPPGSVYITTDSTVSAANMFGGTWTSRTVVISSQTYYFWVRAS